MSHCVPEGLLVRQCRETLHCEANADTPCLPPHFKCAPSRPPTDNFAIWFWLVSCALALACVIGAPLCNHVHSYGQPANDIFLGTFCCEVVLFRPKSLPSSLIQTQELLVGYLPFAAIGSLIQTKLQGKLTSLAIPRSSGTSGRFDDEF